MTPFFKEKLSQKMRLLTIVWGALMISSCVFGFLAFSQAPAENAPALTEVAQMPMAQALFAAALGALVLARVLGGVFLNPERLKALRAKPWTAESLATERVEGRPVYAPDEIPKFLAFGERERTQWLALGPYFVGKIIACALSESCAAMGFVLANQTHQPQVFLPFLALAILGFLMNRPSESEFQARVSM